MSLWKLWSAVLVSSRDCNARLLMGIIQFLVEVASKKVNISMWGSGESDLQIDQLEFVLVLRKAQK